MKILIVLSILISSLSFSQKVSHLYKLGLNEKDELVYVVSKSKSLIIKSDNGKERLIFSLLKDSMKDKKIALIVCTGEGKVNEEDGSYLLTSSRMCKDSTSGKILYKDYELSVEDSLLEAKNIDAVLSQGSDFSELAKSVVDSGRFIIEEGLKKDPSRIQTIKNEAVAK